jgi:hypothetical protein
VTLSPDGRHVYLTNEDEGIAAFGRNGRTGALRQLLGPAGCVLEAPGEGCGAARGIDGTEWPIVSADGRNLYVSTFEGLAAFARNRHSGQLLQLPGRSGCIAAGDPVDREVAGTETCSQPVQRNWGVNEIALSPDGRHIYGLGGTLLTVWARRQHP